MDNRIRKLVLQIETLKRELQEAVNEQERELRFRVEGTRVEFEERLRQAHRELREGLFQWLRSSQPRNVISAPIIYAMVVPMIVFDLALTLYQHLCFRLYRIPRVQRADYLIFDRHHLAYLNLVQKLNCAYCAYANGLLSYAREIAARTEQYWCPIKHARKVPDPHERYLYFTDYGDAEALRHRQQALREALAKGDIPLTELDTHSPAPPAPGANRKGG